MPNTRQAYVELNFKETSRSGDCNLLEWNESEAVLKDVKLEGDIISYALCAGRDTTADRITMSAPISGSQGFKFAVFRAFEAKLNARHAEWLNKKVAEWKETLADFTAEPTA